MLLLLCLLLLVSACASTKKVARPWKPGDIVLCPHCGREFPLPEKLGSDDTPQRSPQPAPLDKKLDRR